MQAEFGLPDHPDFPSYHSAICVGPTSPVSPEEPAAKPWPGTKWRIDDRRSQARRSTPRHHSWHYEVKQAHGLPMHTHSGSTAQYRPPWRRWTDRFNGYRGGAFRHPLVQCCRSGIRARQVVSSRLGSLVLLRSKAYSVLDRQPPRRTSVSKFGFCRYGHGTAMVPA